MEGFVADSYGKVCATHEGERGDLDGRMIYYKEAEGPGVQWGEYQFALGMAFQNGLSGSLFVPFNTFHPGDLENIAHSFVQNHEPIACHASGNAHLL